MNKKLLIKALILSLLFFLAWGALATAKVWAQSKPFYKGKTIRIIVGFTPGGFYDRCNLYGEIVPMALSK